MSTIRGAPSEETALPASEASAPGGALPINPRQRQLLGTIWRSGPLSRVELHRRTGIRPNTVCDDASALIAAGLLREAPVQSRGQGRPRQPLDIDPDRRRVLGLAIRDDAIELGSLRLTGQPAAPLQRQPVDDPAHLVSTACRLLRAHAGDDALAIGVSAPGFIDAQQGRVLTSVAWPNHKPVSLARLVNAASAWPVVMENDMHALAVRWLLEGRADTHEDVLLVYLDDGQLGAALLVNGRPNRGCVTAANELGHTRLLVQTPLCYCGQRGCIERIVSTPFLGTRTPGAPQDLLARATAMDGDDAAVLAVAEYLALTLANAVTFTRVNRLVLAGPLVHATRFLETVQQAIEAQLMPELRSRVSIERWVMQAQEHGHNAAWLAMASLYCEGWL
ncbi:MAG: ROK family protein [Phycisphaeraceae bacterium]